ncbi:superoxide dismutase family protein [Paenibacillus faecalis]|uniref:superoxide dismutase family protein n=1 Tax=Paenibacillus faecalis TaxID=2079532 RepID=UPI000D0F28F4|nr:superoxide dismutase family protein [Paenibacillus faecalis]
MKKRTYQTKHIVGAFLTGAMLFSGFSFAAVSASDSFNSAGQTTEKVSFYVNGEDRSTEDVYENHGIAAPASIVQYGTTYVPVRMVAEMMGTPVFWDQSTRSVSIGTPSVKLFNTSGEPTGSATLEQVNDGVKVKISASGLTPGKHGFHVHENPIESNDFKSAGAHFNPMNKQHGLQNPKGSHVGDMPNLIVEKDGTVEAELIIKHATLEKDQTNSLLGRSLIIHEGEDDEKSDPAGNSGDRIMGGNIPK